VATAESLARRRALAASAIERRVSGLARLFKITVPPRDLRAYPDSEHRQAETDERIAALLTALLRARDPKAPELHDPTQGVIHEFKTEDTMSGTHSGEEPKPQGAFKTLNYDQNTGGVEGVKVTPASREAQIAAATAAGEEPNTAAVTRGAPRTGPGEDDENAPTFGTDHHTLAQLDGKSDEELLQLDGVGDATLAKIKRARAKRDKAAK
jgi:hypothetical protein